MGAGGGYTSAEVLSLDKTTGKYVPTGRKVIAGGGGGGGAGVCPNKSYGIDESSDLLRERS